MEVTTVKKRIAILAAAAVLLVTGCSAEEVASNLVNRSSPTEAPATEAAPTATPGPKETVLALKETGTIGDWEVCVKKASVKNKITNGKYRYFKPTKGKTYIVFDLSVKNNGTKEGDFLPRVGLKNKMVQAILVDANEEEYKPIQLLAYDKDIVTKSIKPSKKKTGIVVFEVPKKVGKDKDNLELQLGTMQEKLLYSVGK